jgi:hypothetical protein
MGEEEKEEKEEENGKGEVASLPEILVPLFTLPAPLSLSPSFFSSLPLGE